MGGRVRRPAGGHDEFIPHTRTDGYVGMASTPTGGLPYHTVRIFNAQIAGRDRGVPIAQPSLLHQRDSAVPGCELACVGAGYDADRHVHVLLLPDYGLY